MSKKIILLSGILLASVLIPVFGQDMNADSLRYFYETEASTDDVDTLTLDEALSKAVEQNHNIVVARNQEEQAENNVFIGNAGFLPRLNLTGSYQRSIQDTYIEFAESEMPPIDRKNAASTTYQAAVELNYTIFDGLSRFYQYSRLQDLDRLADVQTRLQVENTLFQVVQTFLEVARLRESYEINQQAVAISLERLERSSRQYKYGGNTKLDVLNAEVDLNTDSVNLAQSLLNLSNAKRSLNVLMGREPSNDYVVFDNFDLNTSIALENILEKAKGNNANLQVAAYNVSTARLDEKIAGSGNWPGLNLTGSYGYNKQINEAGFLAQQEQLGFTGGVSLNYAIFDANVRSTQIQNAQITVESEVENEEQVRLEVERDVLNAYATYQNNLYLLSKEEDNLETAQLNFERSATALELGQINNTQFREAQLNLIRARRSINNLYYSTKLAEIRLYRLAGLLTEEA